MLFKLLVRLGPSVCNKVVNNGLTPVLNNCCAAIDAAAVAATDGCVVVAPGNRLPPATPMPAPVPKGNWGGNGDDEANDDDDDDDDDPPAEAVVVFVVVGI